MTTCVCTSKIAVDSIPPRPPLSQAQQAKPRKPHRAPARPGQTDQTDRTDRTETERKPAVASGFRLFFFFSFLRLSICSSRYQTAVRSQSRHLPLVVVVSACLPPAQPIHQSHGPNTPLLLQIRTCPNPTPPPREGVSPKDCRGRHTPRKKKPHSLPRALLPPCMCESYPHPPLAPSIPWKLRSRSLALAPLSPQITIDPKPERERESDSKGVQSSCQGRGPSSQSPT